MKNCIFILLLLWTCSCGNNTIENPIRGNKSKVKAEIINDEENKSKLEELAEGKSIPIAILKTRANKEIGTRRFRKTPLIINFWAEWCESCLADAPTFHKLSKKYPEANFISISIDKQFDDWLEFLKDEGLKGKQYFMGRDEENPLFPLVYSEVNSEDVKGVHIALPKYVFITADGIVAEINSASPQTDKFQKALGEFLK